MSKSHKCPECGHPIEEPISEKEKKRLKECDDFYEFYMNNLFCSSDELSRRLKIMKREKNRG